MGFLETVLEGVINAIEQDMENQRKRFKPLRILMMKEY